MINRLRKKFIILSAVSLLLLLAVIVVSSSVITYKDLIDDADAVLTLLADRSDSQGSVKKPSKEELTMEELAKPETLEQQPSEKPSEKPDGTGESSSNAPKPQGNPSSSKTLSPETMYESRFFTALVSAESEITHINTENIISVSDEAAASYALTAIKKSGANGFIGSFRYYKQERENGTYVIFLDCGRKLDTFLQSLMINSIISLVGFLVSMVVIVVFSKKIMRPVLESYEKQKQFISVAGHELKTPVTIIDADAAVLSMEIETENEWLSDIQNQTKRMAVLTNDLLNLSRMDENREQFTKIEFPISDVVSETVQSFQTLAHSKNRNIIADITPMLSYTGDEKAIRQITGILLDNAIKYSTAQDIELSLKLVKKGRGKSIVLTVENAAEPLDDSQLHQFFDRFYRTEQSRNSEKGGYGLGLSIAKSMVEAHKGKITASSPENGRVQITVTLKAL